MLKGLKKMVIYAAVVAAVGSFSNTRVYGNTGESFLPGTTINQVPVAGMTAEQARETLTAHYQQDYRLEIAASENKREFISGSEIGYEVRIPDLAPLFEQIRSSGNYKAEVAVTYLFHENLLKDKLSALECVSSDQVTVTRNARISGYEEGKPFSILKEVQGDSIDRNKLLDSARHELATGGKTVYVGALGCYDQITVTSEQDRLKELLEQMNAYSEMEITYEFGDAKETLQGETIRSWIYEAEGMTVGVNRDKAARYVADLAGKYNTANSTRTFQSASGREVSVAGSYGWVLNQQAETDALIGMIQTGQSQERSPAYSQTAVSRNFPDWGNTYVEIDLTGQHVYLFQNGEITWNAPCVTGNVARGDTTPPGIFTLKYKQTDRVLRGKIMADGKPEYESPVKYWMPFNGGIGLHDANWRSRFGGEIYKNSGSHGCINLPPNTVKSLFDNVYPGIPIICYN